MEIIIGSAPHINREIPPKRAPVEGGAVEAKLLHIRKPRKGIAGPSGMERRQKQARDPVKGRVLTVLVPDAALLPKDIDSAEYRVILRFSRK
ncbi:MAG: hypothetical protein V2I35_07080 [Desulfocapsaceae bacterium]|jgi:hypothetical protein|nr:hypothetical protein [Desulfocapsaceae bacterium]